MVVVYVVYRPMLTVDLKIFTGIQEAQLYTKTLLGLGEASKTARAIMPDDSSSAWVVVFPEGPKLYRTLAEAPNDGVHKPALVVISRPQFMV